MFLFCSVFVGRRFEMQSHFQFSVFQLTNLLANELAPLRHPPFRARECNRKQFIGDCINMEHEQQQQ